MNVLIGSGPLACRSGTPRNGRSGARRLRALSGCYHRLTPVITLPILCWHSGNARPIGV